LIFSLYLFEDGNSDVDFVADVFDLGNFDSHIVVCYLHWSEGYFDCSLFLSDLCFFLCLSLSLRRIEF
jgi:hypothetical protein